MTDQPKDDHIIVAVHVTERVKQASLVQSILTEYGDIVKTRIGLHEPTTQGVSPSGVILLELLAADGRSADIITALNALQGVEAKSIIFQH